MPFNGTGTYNLPSGNPVVTGTTISSTWGNNTMSDIASALSNCLTRDGQGAPTANIPMSGFKLTGLPAGTVAGDSVRYEQVTSALAATGGTINGVVIGGTTPAAGSFTTLSASGASTLAALSASGTVSGAGFTTWLSAQLASPPAIGGITPAAGSFTTIGGTTITASVQFSGPHNGTVGATTPNTGAFTTLSASGTVSGVGFSNYLASPPAIGGTAPAAGAFTTLSASSTVSGTGFSNYLAAPPAIGGTTPNTGKFSTITVTSNVTYPDNSTQTTAATGFGFKNRIINGAMQVSQKASSATVTAGTSVPTASTGYPCVDRFFVYSTGANVTAAQVSGSGSTKSRLQITGAASVTAVGVGQRIEQLNSYDLANNVCTLSVDLANSVLTTVTWTASYANTADTFGTIGTPSKTQIATGTFTVTSTVTNYTTSITVPSAATTGIEILFTVGAQTSGTWTIGNVQFEKAPTATSFAYRPYGTELALCQRFFQTHNVSLALYGASGNALYTTTHTQVQMRSVPTATTTTAPTYTNASGFNPNPTGAVDITYGLTISATGAGVASGAGITLSSEL